MRAPHRVALLMAPALLVLSSCGITETGVVEAGGPASGIVATTPVYLVKNGALVAVPVRTARPGNAGAALELLLGGPSGDEQHNGITTELPGLPNATSPVTTSAPGFFGGPTETTAAAPTTPTTPAVSVEGDTLSVRLPYKGIELPPLARQQLICTAAAAHRMAAPSAGPVTVILTDNGGWRVKGTDERCPAP